MAKKIAAAFIALTGLCLLGYGVLDLIYWGIELQSVSGIVCGLAALVAAVCLFCVRKPDTSVPSAYDQEMARRRAERVEAERKNAEHVAELKSRAYETGVACCPRCGCTTLFQYRKPWNWKLALIGIWFFGVGALLGFIGEGGYCKCAKCGNIWRP